MPDEAKTTGKRGGVKNPPAPEPSEPPASIDDLHGEHAAAQEALARTAGEALAAVSRRSAEAQSELVAALQGLWGEVVDVHDCAARALPGRLQEVLADGEARDTCAQAHQDYADAVTSVAEAHAAAVQAARDAEQELAAAAQRGEAEDDVRRLAQRAQEAVLEAVQTTSPSNELVRHAQDAQAACESVVAKAREDALRKVVDTIRESAESRATALTESDVSARHEAAVARYGEVMSELSAVTQRTLLQAQIRAMGEMQAAWSTVGDGAAAAAAAQG